MANRQVTLLQGSPSDLVSRLRVAEVTDASGDKRRQQAGTRAGCAFGLAFLSLFAGAIGATIFANVAPALVPLAFLPTVGLLAFAGFSLWNYLRSAAADLDSERLTLARELLERLAPDLSDKKPVLLTIRHGDAAKHGTVSNQRKVGSWAAGQVRYSEHEDSWLSVSGRLRDGSAFKLLVTRQVKRKAKPKRKYTKIRDRMWDRVVLLLRVDPARYPGLARLQESLRPALLNQNAGLALAGSRIQGTSVRVSARTGQFTREVLRYSRPETGEEHRLTGAKLVSLFAFLYAGLSHCTPEAGRGAGGSGPMTGAGRGS